MTDDARALAQAILGVSEELRRLVDEQRVDVSFSWRDKISVLVHSQPSENAPSRFLRLFPDADAKLSPDGETVFFDAEIEGMRFSTNAPAKAWASQHVPPSE